MISYALRRARLHRLPLGKTRLRATDISQGRELTPEWGVKRGAGTRQLPDAISSLHANNAFECVNDLNEIGLRCHYSIQILVSTWRFIQH